ncbi:MAG: PEP-CTERM sorting domain-containing protein [Planctomycetia bacterium]
MSMFNNTSRFNCLGSAAAFAALALMATAAFGGTLTYNDPALTASPYVKFTSVSEEWSDVQNGSPDAVLSPPPPAVSLFPNGTGILFSPANFLKVETSSTSRFDLRTKATTLRVNAQGQTPGVTPDVFGYALNDVNFTIGGELTVWAPLSSPPQPYNSYAQSNVAAPYVLVLKQVNWQSVAEQTQPGSVPLTLTNIGTGSSTVGNSISVEQFGPGSKEYYSWAGNFSLSQSALKTLFGITDPDKYVTQVEISLSPNISVVGVYGEGYAKVTNIGVSSNTVAVAVPEPPTVILAGLGVAAAVGQGYRRRKSQRNAQAGAEMVGDETGVIALTA